MEKQLLLKNAQIITLNNAHEVIANGFIGISGNEIDYVGAQEPKESYQRTLDCKGKTVMPGFVNAHNHGAMTLFRNYADDMKLMDWLFTKIFPLEDKLTEDAAYWASMLAMVEMIKGGTTTFSDMYFFMNKTAEAVGQSGMRAVLSRGLQGDTGIADLDYRLKENLELHQNFHNSFDGRIKVMLGPHSIYTCSVEYLKKLNIKAAEAGISIQIHLSETKDEVSGCIQKHGISPVRLLDGIGMLRDTTLAAHCVILEPGDMEILADKKVNVVHNPGSNMKLASGISPVTEMAAMGINLCLGTDGASSNNNLDLLEEMRTATYLQKIKNEDPTALPVDQVLRMATVNGAKALGFNNIGQLQPGMAADMAVFNTEKAHYYPKYNIKSSLVYSGNSADVETVIINGNIVMEKGILTTLDEEKILYETQKWADCITA